MNFSKLASKCTYKFDRQFSATRYKRWNALNLAFEHKCKHTILFSRGSFIGY